MRGQVKLAGLGLAFLLVLASVRPADAITYGVPDEGAHPNVGALVGTFSGGTYPYCSGTLVAPTLFLTAAHCNIGTMEVFVIFDEQYTAKSKLHKGTFHGYQEYPGASNDPGDIAIVVFDKPIRRIAPASLPYLGQFDEMAVQGGLIGQTFTAVGYGSLEPENGAGGWSFTYEDRRMKSTSSFNALNNVWLRLSQNNATGDGGTCYGDSGGPNFLGDSMLVASITVTGDVFCRATNDTYRLDSPTARQFLSGFGL